MLLKKTSAVFTPKKGLNSKKILNCFFLGIITILVVLYIATGLMVRAEFTDNIRLKTGVVEKNMYIAFEQLNTILKNGEQLIRENHQLLSEDFNEISVEDMLGIIDEINKLETYNPFIQEMLIFKKGEENYITSQGIVLSSDFFNYDYGDTEYNREYFERVFYDYNSLTVLPVREFKKTFNYDGDSVLRVFIVPKIYKIYDIGIILMINEQSFIDYCGISEEDTRMQISLYNHEGSLIISNRPDEAPIRLSDSIPEGKSSVYKNSLFGSTTQIKWFNYEGMIFHTRSSFRSGNIITLVFLLLVLIAFGVFLYLRRKVSLLEEGMVKLSKVLQLKEGEKADFKVFGEYIDRLKAEVDKAKQNDAFIKKAHLSFMTKGDCKDLSPEAYMSDFIYAQSFGMFILISESECSDKEISGLLSTEDTACQVFADGRGRYVGLLAFKKVLGTDAEQKLDKAVRKLKQLSEGRIVVLYSDVFSDMSMVESVYNKLSSSLILLRYKDEIVCIKNLCGVDINALPENIGGELNKLLSSGNAKSIQSFFMEKLNGIINENPSYYRLFFCMEYYTMQFSEVFIRLSKDHKKLSEIKKQYMQSLRKYTYRLDVQGALNGLCNMISLSVEKFKGDMQVKDIGEILNYIHENYKKEMYLEKISEVFNMKPKYFSYYFKREFGIGFNEYLTQLRIEEAKKLLKTSNESISKIGQMVGYFNQITFNSAFKKYTGISPSVYRSNGE